MISLPLKKPELFQYSPHQRRMLLLDQVEQFDMEEMELISSLLIHEGSEFFNANRSVVPIWISFEYMAQSIAVLTGLTHMNKGKPPEIGFIMSVSNFVAHKSGFSPNDTVLVHICQTFRDGKVGVFEGTAKVNNMLYSTATLSVIENSPELRKRWTVSN